MKTLLRLLLKSQHQQNLSEPAQTEKGMTLVELLIGTVMAFLILTPMLTFVVDMLNTDRREQVKSNTEQDIQAAVDFIAQDLSQAIYIYDNNPAKTSTPTNIATGIPAIQDQLPAPVNGTPILVFWKRQLIKNAVPINSTVTAKKPSACPDPTKTATPAECNDTYVLSLVAYYQIRETDPKSIWCQPSGAAADCPTRIARYEIRDGVKNPNSTLTDANFPYYDIKDKKEYAPDPAFNRSFDISKPTEQVALSKDWGSSDVLVNYIDHGTKPTFTGKECTTALGNPTTTIGTKISPISEDTLKVTDRTTDINSFYACVDTSRNLARVTLRGNSLRRLQTDAKYDANKSAFFPTATVQVQGLGARGR